MSDDTNHGVARLLRILAERLEAYLEGDELAFETVTEELEEAGVSADDLQTAGMLLRSMSGRAVGAPVAAASAAPGKRAHRVPSPEELDSLSPEAWGYLLDLRRSGSLDAEQFERVVDLLTTSGMRPVSVDLAREVAARVALHDDGPDDHGEPNGEFDVAH